VLADPQLDPSYRLGQVLEALARCHEEWDQSQRVADDIDPTDDLDLLDQARREVRSAYRRWFEISAQAAELAQVVRRTHLEIQSNRDWDALRQHTLDDLLAQFEGGPHYVLLCERASGLHVRLKQMEASGRDFSPAEHAQLNAQLLAYINQLQKYTEAMKSESISREAQSVAESILQIVEKHCAATYPELYLGVVKDVRSALEAA
jgi:hypothetical protein